MKARQKDIWYAQLNPVKGSEQGGRRPIVIISGDTMNGTLPIVIACPVSSKIKEYPGCVTVRARKDNGLKQDSEVATFQVRVLSQTRLTKKIGAVGDTDFRAIMLALNEVLVL
ncbi:MAG: type II toxin-antitoxin system PemK/MazF family toxin [Patescibacteria group bacterium]